MTQSSSIQDKKPTAVAVLLLSAAMLLAVVHAEKFCEDTTSSSQCGKNFRNKDLALKAQFETLVRRWYHDQETNNFADELNLLAPDATFCATARVDIGCYHGAADVVSYTGALDPAVTEIIRVYEQTPLEIYTDIVARTVSVQVRWSFFSYPKAANFTLIQFDTFTFNCDSPPLMQRIISRGDKQDWTAAELPPISDHNVTRICAGDGGILLGVQDVCFGANQQYASVQACEDFLNTKPEENGGLSFGYGDSIGCRDWHLGLARVDPNIHCVHVGPDGGGKCTNMPAAPAKRHATHESVFAKKSSVKKSSLSVKIQE